MKNVCSAIFSCFWALANVLRHTNLSKTGLRGRVGEGKALEEDWGLLVNTHLNMVYQHGKLQLTRNYFRHQAFIDWATFSRTQFNVFKTEICKYTGLFASLGFGQILPSLRICRNNVYYLCRCLLFIISLSCVLSVNLFLNCYLITIVISFS